MVNQSECSKKFKKLCDWTVSTRKKEIRIAKDYSKLWANYSTIKDSISENTKQLNSVKFLLQKKSKNVEALKKLNKDREKELEHVKEEINALQEKITAIQSNESQESERKKFLQLQLLHLIVMKTCTKTHIDDKIPHLIRGFTANEESLKVIPLAIDQGRLTKSEIQNALWENCYRCSGYANEWNHLFAAGTDGNI